MTQHIEGSFGLIGWYHVTSFVHKDKPKIVVNFGPACVLSVDGPDLFLGSFPEGGVDPVQVVEIVQNSRGIDHEVILTVEDHHFESGFEDCNEVSRIAATDVNGKCIKYFMIGLNIVDRLRDTEFSSVLLEKLGKLVIWLTIMPEIIC